MDLQKALNQRDEAIRERDSFLGKRDEAREDLIVAVRRSGALQQRLNEIQSTLDREPDAT